MKAEEIMTRDVITVKKDTRVETIARLLMEHRISGVPVLDDNGCVVGIVCESDLFLKEKGIPFSAVKVPTLFEKWVDPKQLAEIYENVRSHFAEDVMTKNPTCVNSQEDVGHVAWIMMKENLKRVPVTEKGRLVGIITRADIIRLLAQE